MAQGFRFVCGKCDHIIVVWDDGNPYVAESPSCNGPNADLLNLTCLSSASGC